MAFKGDPHSVGAGRKKGTPNKATQDLHAVCEAHGVDPFEALIELVLILPKTADMRFAAIKEICQYLYPKRKALEHSGEIANPMAAKSDEELKAIVRDILDK